MLFCPYVRATAGPFLALLARCPGSNFGRTEERDKGRKVRGVVGMGALLVMGGGGRAVVADDEVQQLRKQLAEQRQLMETMEKRLGDLEGKEKEQKSKGLEAGYTVPHMSE